MDRSDSSTAAPDPPGCRSGSPMPGSIPGANPWARTRPRSNTAQFCPRGVSIMMAVACANCRSWRSYWYWKPAALVSAAIDSAPVRKCQPSAAPGGRSASGTPSSSAASGVSRGSKLTVSTSNSRPRRISKPAACWPARSALPYTASGTRNTPGSGSPAGHDESTARA